LFEREQFAIGASVRNFGLLWPIGQEPGIGLERALRSREHWLAVADQAGFWAHQNGSLHAVYHDDEWDVLHEFMELYKGAAFQCALLTADQVKEKSKHIKSKNLKGGLWSSTECTVNPREAIRRIPSWLQEKFGLITRFGSVVTEIAIPNLKTSRETWRVDHVYVCSGADFETLYPKVYDQQPVVKCRLQMMKAVSASHDFRLGPSLCAGLTLRHYSAFSKCPSLQRVDARYDVETDEFKKYGIHVLLSQNNEGDLIIGDSHHYEKTIEPFDREAINDIILRYLHSFVELGDINITERWHGIYAKMQGNIDLIVEPEKNVTIVNGLGGAGMTLSFGLAEEIVERL
jgi:FAD dependent oxidoreductase TIGR03364